MFSLLYEIDSLMMHIVCAASCEWMVSNMCGFRSVSDENGNEMNFLYREMLNPNDECNQDLLVVV